MSHTQGPWAVDCGSDFGGGWYVRPCRPDDGGLTGYMLVHLKPDRPDVPYHVTTAMGGTAEGNARLIAAAPDLLEALKALLYHKGDFKCGISGELQSQAEAAIAKAEGKAL